MKFNEFKMAALIFLVVGMLTFIGGDLAKNIPYLGYELGGIFNARAYAASLDETLKSGEPTPEQNKPVGPIDTPRPRINPTSKSVKEYENYSQVIQKTVSMVANANIQQLASKHGLNVLNVTWEDTGRYKGSCVGPNISDMTIQVQTQDPRTQNYQLFCMPVIRFPNYSDKSCDVKPENFYLLVGNEKGKSLKKVNLREFLGNLRSYLSKPDSWKGDSKSLLAERDTHVLVSAQACFLPIPKSKNATFNPVLFNYQSYAENPAVLTILATREGTSVTIIDNKRDGFAAGGTWGQRLFFNQKGSRASLTGKRMSDFLAEKPDKRGGDNNNNAVSVGKDKGGLNMVLLIQVPLKHKAMRLEADECAFFAAPACQSAKGSTSNVENAVIGHGKVEGPFTEIDGLAIERDDRFPVRVTVQFYKATDNGVADEKDLKEIASQIEKVYKNADYVGSLVVGGETQRPTEYRGSKVEPPDWWRSFWKQHQEKNGMTEEETRKLWRRLFGPSNRTNS